MDERTELLSSVGNELVSKRTQLGWSLEEAAASARVDPERLAAAEEGEAPLESDELDRVAGAYGVNATYFFGGRTTPLQYLFGA